MGNQNSGTHKVKSTLLGALDALGVKYRLKGNQATLVEWDSLTINLSGKYAGYWTRWSRDKQGRGHEELISYMVDEGLVERAAAEKVLGGKIKDVSVEVQEVKPYDFKTMVTDPDTYKIERWLTNVRKLSPVIVKRFIELGLVVCDGRGNIRFLWKDVDDEVIGADVQGIEYDVEKYGKRGTLKIILPGSDGFFHVTSADVKSYEDVENIYFFEAPIDLMSFVELSAVPNAAREDTPFTLPTAKPKSMYVSLSGASKKLQVVIDRMRQGFPLRNLKTVYIAGDNDEGGDELFEKAKELIKRAELIRLLPNEGEKVFDGAKLEVINDWNDLLKRCKA